MVKWQRTPVVAQVCMAIWALAVLAGSAELLGAADAEPVAAGQATPAKVLPSAPLEPPVEPAPAATLEYPGWTKESFIMGPTNAQKAWVDHIPAPDAWNPVAQPDLADVLGKAPKLEIEQAGPPVRVVSVTRGHVLLIPNKDKTWDALFHYYQSYAGEQEVIIADLGTGKQKTIWFNSNRPDGRKEMVSPFGAWYARGKLFWATNATNIAWYDPELNDIFYRQFDGPTFHGHCRALGDDQNIYYLGAKMGKDKTEKNGFVAAIFDTEKMQMTWHEPFGPSSMNTTIFYAKFCMDGDWMYASIGNRPWYLLAYNFKTKENHVLATAPIIGDYGTIRFGMVAGGGVTGSIREADFVEGIEKFDKEKFNFWLKDGKIYARTGDTPPWSTVPIKGSEDFEYLFRWSNIQYWPKNWTPPSTPPYFDAGDRAATTDGEVVRSYTYGGKGETHEIKFKVSSYPAVTAALTEVNQDVIFGTSTQYAEHIFFNTKTKQYMGGGAVGISGYTCGITGDLFSVCGYPNSITAYYDPTRKLDLQEQSPNPLVINSFGKYSDTHYPTAGIVRGADGRIYSGGHGAGRTRKGGGWSWYDPATKEVGGEKFEWDVLSLADAASGRYILLSGGGKLSCWDTTTHKFLYQEKLQGVDNPGYIVEALPGLIIGFTSQTTGEDKKSVLYGCDPVTRKIFWIKEVPASYKSPRMPLYSNPYCFRRGPDGFIWTYFENTLVRIDPRTAEVVPVGTAQGKKAFIGFAGGEVYIAGQMGLAKIKGLAVPVVAKP